MPTPYITPSFLLQDARYNQSLPPSEFDPNYSVDPTTAIQAQQAYLKQMFAMQNPRLALPQQFGQAIGNLLQGGGPQAAPTPGPGSGPQDPVAAAIHQKAVAYGAQGSDPGEALFKAAGDVERDPSMGGAPNAQKWIEKARTYAIKTYGYNPEQEKQRQFERDKAPLDNLKLPNGKIVGAQAGTPEYKAYINAGAVKAGEQPQIAVGTRREDKQGGMYITTQWDGEKWKQVGKSTQPMQYQVSGTPDQMAEGGLLGTTGTTAANDKNRKELADRQISTVNALRSIDSISDTIKQSQGSAVGTAGDWYEKGNNIVQTARNLAGNFNQQDLLDPKQYNWKGLDNVVASVRGKAIDATKYHAQMVATAYAMAAAQSNNNTDEKMTKQRVEANLEILAEHSDDPQAVLSALGNARQMLKDNFKTTADVYSPSYKAEGIDQYENSRKPKSSGVGPYSDAEKEARYQAWKKAHGKQ